MKLLGKNIRIKLLSVFIAILVWFYVAEIQTTDMTRTITNIPITIINTETLNGKELTFVPEKDSLFTTIKVKGTKEVIRKLTSDNFEITADASNINSIGLNKMTLKVDFVNISNIEILSLLPSKLELNIEKLESVEKDININFKGENKDDIIYDVTNINPEKVVIKGSKSIIDTISDVTVDIDVSSQSATDIVTFKDFAIIDQLGNDITDNEGLIFEKNPVQIEAEALKMKTVPVEMVISGQPANGFEVKNKTLSISNVVIVGKESDIANIDKIYTKPIYITGVKQTQKSIVEFEDSSIIKRILSAVDNKTLIKDVEATVEISAIQQ